ncbi:MAG: hypothetical protein B7Y05_05940 [Polynucleobacter sp. 24-46-87]|nr:MAG: hypothetical protein B7Y55_00515 [Polynucleobacter sp. 35-46-207]OZA14908.1 MAG: hypothetical protein B7Y05_05940 [Polynucleobacter sp. 24-46-87]OZA41777.1 MAG: hypothetical protein B7X83_01345 [Polynucleobacter sp. 17-46-58]OZB49187.1 MAG: hypothetical protein B7X60_01995 [Polynucleobacter sp. 39-45-136]
MLNLKNVTLLCVETREPELAYWAIDKCLSGTQFAKVVLITNLDRVSIKRVDIEYVQAPPINTTKDYSELLLTGLDQYVESSHVLVIQWDSFIINPELWTTEFLAYDYIGAVWPHHPQSPVGNGGFSLRSKRLLQTMKSNDFKKQHPEDYCICVDNKDFLIQRRIKFAPAELAERFSVERSPWHSAFGFHGFFNFEKVLGDAELTAFLKILPEKYLSSLDAYELVTNLRAQDRIYIAKKIARKIRFRWKMRKQFLKLRYWILSS